MSACFSQCRRVVSCLGGGATSFGGATWHSWVLGLEGKNKTKKPSLQRRSASCDPSGPPHERWEWCMCAGAVYLMFWIQVGEGGDSPLILPHLLPHKETFHFSSSLLPEVGGVGGADLELLVCMPRPTPHHPFQRADSAGLSGPIL